MTCCRAYSIAQRNVWIGRALVLMYIAVLVVCFYLSSTGDCRPHTSTGRVVQRSTWPDS